jgi:putative oxidoreductase
VIRALSLVLRLGLGALFVVAGVLKLRDPTAFATDIANYQLLPGLAPYLAAALPLTEVLAGLLLVVGRGAWRLSAAVAIGLMMLAFTGAASSALARGIDISCGCFGGDRGTVDGLTIARDLALLAAVAAVLFLERRRPAPSATP